jgi:predicted PurR-regulated permease PerM
MTPTNPNNTLRQVLFLSFIILLGVVMFVQLASFIPALLGSYTLFVLLKKWMYILTGRYKWRKSIAAGLLMLTSFIVILLPIVLLINMMASKINFAVQHSSAVVSAIQQFIRVYEKRYNIEIISENNVRELASWASQSLRRVLGATFNGLIAIVFTYFILYFMLINGRKMENNLIEQIPMKNHNVLLLRQETNSLVYSNAIGIPMIALIGYLILGVKEPGFWFVVTCIASMMPVVGAALAYVPVAILLFADGMNFKGVLMLCYGFGVISTLDSVFRFWLQKKIGDVHPLITAFGVILGLNLFGFIGLIFGPILISLFILMIKIYANEFGVARVT